MSSPSAPATTDPTAREAAERRLKRRYRAEGRFRAYGIAAILVAVAALILLLTSIVSNAVSAFTKHDLSVEVLIDPAVVDPAGKKDPEQLRANVGAFTDLIRADLRKSLPDVGEDRALRRQMSRMVSSLSAEDLAHQVADDPALVGQSLRARVPMSDTMDLYLKGLATRQTVAAGSVAAAVTPMDERVAIAAPGAFAQARSVVADAVEREAAGKQAAADSARVQAARVQEQLTALEAQRAALGPAAGASLAALAEAAAGKEEDLLALARAAGAASAGADAGPLRTELSRLLQERIAQAEDEAKELRRKSGSFGVKAANALKRGEPTAETRRIQSETAMLAAIRKQADADLMKTRLAAVPTARLEELLAASALVADRPLVPLAGLAGAETESDRLAASRAVNAAETLAARAAVNDQTQRIALLEAALTSLRQANPEQTKTMEGPLLGNAKSRLARLDRELATFVASGETLAVLAGDAPAPAAPPSTPDTPPAVPTAPAPQASPAPTGPATAATPAPPAEPLPPEPTPAERLQAETDAQTGLDFGGPLAVAYALGALDANAPNAEARLRALLAARQDIDLADARRDLERLQRKTETQSAAAQTLRALIASPSSVLELDPLLPSVLVEINGGVVKATRVGPDLVEGGALMPLKTAGQAAAGAWTVRTLHTAEADRLVTDHQAAWANALKQQGKIERVANLDLLTKADSTYPELAGLFAALVGSFWIILVTLVLSLPIGVMAAIYLQEFAPKNRITDLIEVNINNLAAVPSIVFGLLGAAVFINFFNLPRSAPIVGGMVLSLITLPTVIIATRAALGAVPPSIRDGALAVGASLPQAVFHHMLPLAAPGVMTGAIIGLARALGETAPLLLIGMVAFVADPPDSMFDSATALPVLVYKWASAAERAWQPMTAAAILVLLAFMFVMNALAVYLRRRLERRW